MCVQYRIIMYIFIPSTTCLDQEGHIWHTLQVPMLLQDPIMSSIRWICAIGLLVSVPANETLYAMYYILVTSISFAVIWVICAYPIPSQLYMTTQSEIDLSCKNRSCIADSNFFPQDQSPASAWRLITYLLWGSNILSFKSLVRSGKPQIQALVLVGREEPAVPVVITKLSRASCSMKHFLDDSWWKF